MPAQDVEIEVVTEIQTFKLIVDMKTKIKELFNLEQITTKDYTYLANSRQISLAKQAYKNLLDAERAIEEEQPVDMIEIDLKEDERTIGQYSSFLRNKINPNLKTCFRKVYLNGNRKPIKELILVDDEWWDIKDIKKEQQVI